VHVYIVPDIAEGNSTCRLFGAISVKQENMAAGKKEKNMHQQT
jgi:hypothetical protein